MLSLYFFEIRFHSRWFVFDIDVGLEYKIFLNSSAPSPLYFEKSCIKVIPKHSPVWSSSCLELFMKKKRRNNVFIFSWDCEWDEYSFSKQKKGYSSSCLVESHVSNLKLRVQILSSQAEERLFEFMSNNELWTLMIFIDGRFEVYLRIFDQKMPLTAMNQNGPAGWPRGST